MWTAKKPLNKYAPYWEDDTTMNPVLVRYIDRHGDFWNVRLPDGTIREVHGHHLGYFR